LHNPSKLWTSAQLIHTWYETRKRKLSQISGLEDDLCGICLQEIESATGVLPCAHAFCFSCINEWGKVSNVCPKCRARFNKITTINANEGGEVTTDEVPVVEANLRMDTEFDPLDAESDDDSEEEGDDDSDYLGTSDEEEEESCSDTEEPKKKRRKTASESSPNDSEEEEGEHMVETLLADQQQRAALASLQDLVKTQTIFICAAQGCEKSFKRKADLERHLLIHLGIKNFACEECDKRFTRKGDLTAHKRSHVKEEDKRFVCDSPGCGKSYTLRNNLARHKKTAHEGKRHACTVCKKEFTQTGDLTRHMRVHNDIRPFACDACEMRFKQKAHLNQHKKTHARRKD